MIQVKDKMRRNVLVSTDHGLMIVNRFDCNFEQVGHGQWLLDHGSTSTVEAQAAWDHLKDRVNPVIFDVGANIGTFTTWMAKIFPEGQIHCFEPQRLVFQMLCGNIAINNFDNCWAHNFALGATSGVVQFQEPDYFKQEDFGVFSLVEDNLQHKSGVVAITQVVTLDTFVNFYGIPRVDYIKIDVEGMDIDVLRGAEQTLKRFSPAIFIEHSNNKRSVLDGIIAHLGVDNYTFQVIANNVLAVPK